MNTPLVLMRGLLLMAALTLAEAAQAAEAAEALVRSTNDEMLATITRTQDRQQLLEAVETSLVTVYREPFASEIKEGARIGQKPNWN